ncbi:hypothetical protein GCM10027347_45940 [Larkinella harenae]
MLHNIFFYLLQGTALLAVFTLVYRLFLGNLTHFQWNRVYLLVGVIASSLVPLIPVPGLFGPVAPTELAFRFGAVPIQANDLTGASTEVAVQTVNSFQWVGYALMGFYLLGVLYKSARFYRNLRVIFRLKQASQLVDERADYSVYIQSELPTFSFGRSIFLNPEHESLTSEEQAQVLLHEEIHVQHRHTLDLLLFELAGIVFWFNPLIRYLHVSIRQVHEYMVDASVTRLCGNVRQYGYLLLKMTSESTLPLMATFSDRQLVNRIQMLTQKPSGSMQKLKFLVIAPLLAFSLLVSSCFRNSDQPVFRAQTVKPQHGVPVGTIVWKGNKVYTTAQLNEVLGLRPGDLYEKEALANRLTNQAGTDLTSLYMDKGYLFSNVEVKEKRVGDAVNLELSVYEGPQMTVEKVTFKGNKKITDAQMRTLVAVRPGELFNRSNLIKSQLVLAQSGYFNSKQVGINPIPHTERNTVDLEFTVIED